MNCTLLQLRLRIVLKSIGMGRGVVWIFFRNYFCQRKNFTGVPTNFGSDCSSALSRDDVIDPT